MALDSYSSLKSSLQDWLQGRTDLATVSEDCIALAEADFNRTLRVREMETSSTLTPSSGEATLPTDYLAWRTVTALTDPRRELEYVAPSYIEDEYGDREAGTPAFFTIRGSTILIVPYPTGNVRLDYFQKIPALSDANTSNWLLEAYPNLYLYQSLKHLAVYLDNDAAAQKYAGLANGAMEALTYDDSTARFNRISARISGPTP